MRIQHNIMAMNAYRNYNNNTSALSKNLEKLSSGYKINRAGDDAAGLAISEKMRAQITGLNAAQKNVKDGISLVKTGEGAMQEIQDMLNRMDYLATQSANGTYDNEVDRLNLQKEVDALKTEINRIADSANFNGIKLLDGSLDRNVLATEAGVKTENVDFAKGIDFEIGEGGGGSKGEFSLTIDNLFGAGDTLAIGGTDTAGTAITETLTFGTDFSGKTAEEQAKSLADALSKKSTLADFDVSVDGATVTLTNKVEGSGQAMINPNGFTVTDAATTVDTTNTKASTPGADGTLGSVDFAKLFDGATNGGKDIGAGDTVTFEFEMASGAKYKAELEITDAMIGKDTSTTTANIARELANVKLTPNNDTAAAEEQLKVGDLFTITANGTNKGDLKFDGTSGTGGVDLKAATVATTRDSSPLAGTPATVGAATKEVFDLAMDNSAATDFTAGDKITLKGQLSDGRKYELELTAGKDFELGGNYKASFTNLKNLLEVKGKDITVKDANGKEEIISSEKLFGTGKEFELTADTNKLSITAQKGGVAGGKGVSSTESITVTPATATSITQAQVNGTQQTGAKSTISFSEGLQYGATIDIDGQTYEIVKTGERTSSAKNVAVEVDDLSDTSAVAKSMADAVNKQLGGDPITANASGNKVTLLTKEIGSTAVSPKVSTAGDKVKQLEFTLDPSKVQEGSYVTINGQSYQFVSDKSKVTNDKMTAVVVDFKNATSASLGQALKDVADGKNNTSVTVDADGLVKVRGTENEDGEIVTPTASFHDGKGGLTLQIGDTAEEFNQMNVSIGDMHTAALGIDGIDIGNQDGAKAAIDVIKNAINYVSGVRGDLGAVQNRLDHTANNLSVMAENIQDAESTIRDTDVAEEMMSYVKNNILVQSAQAMLAQANQVPQGVLQLLG